MHSFSSRSSLLHSTPHRGTCTARAARTRVMAPAAKWWTSSTVAVVTGANKGIGKEIARLLAQEGLTVVVAARDEARGKAAVEDIAATTGAADRVHYQKMDLEDVSTHATLKSWLGETFPGGINILVNNAAMSYKGDTFGAKELRHTLEVNYYNTAALTETLLPLLQPQGRVVTVASRAGTLDRLPSQALRDRFTNASSKAEVDKLAQEFQDLLDNGGDFAAAGWPRGMYGVSKALVLAYTRILGKQLEPKGIKVASCCPGWCVTDMSSGMGNKTAVEGADTPVWLATMPWDELLSGQFWAERQHISY